MFNITQIEYYPKPEKRKVVAIIRGVDMDAAYELMSKTNSSMLLMPGRKYLEMPFMLKATAYCHPSDEFDEAKGRKVAKKRLMKMYNKIKASTIRNYLDRVENFCRDGRMVQNSIYDRANQIDVYSDI